MTQETKDAVQYGSAIAMLAAGVLLSILGFFVPPVGEISDSVLWFFGQCLIYAGSVFGLGIYIENKFSDLKRRMPPPKESEKSQRE